MPCTSANQALHLTGGACRLSPIRSSLMPRRQVSLIVRPHGATMRRRKFVILIVVVLAALVPLGWAFWRLASRAEEGGPPSGLLPLADAGAFPPQYRSAARAVADAIALGGERSEDFFAEVEVRRSDGMIVFHLWHRSAFEPGNRGVFGNPGGKCRDVRFDSRRGQVVKIRFWQ